MRRFCYDLRHLKKGKEPGVLEKFVADTRKRFWPTAATVKKEVL